MFEELLSRKGLSLDRLRVLLELREAGSIAKAADSDPVRQSQYSRQLKELDEFFGVALTERKGRNLALTAAGEKLACMVHEQFIALSDFANQVSDQPINVNIGAGESLIHWMLMPICGKIQKSLPGLHIHFENLTSSRIAQRVRDRDLDFGLLRNSAVPPNTGSKSIGTLSYSLFVPRLLANAAVKRKDASALAQLPLAAMPGTVTAGKALRDAAEDAGLALNLSLQANTFTALARAVETGHYAAVLPNHASRIMPKNVLALDLPMLKGMKHDITLIWAQRRLGMNPKLGRLKNLLLKELKCG